PDQRLAACRTLSAATVPDSTIVSARPMLKHSTSVAPSVTFFSCRHSSSTVMAAGQGTSPPVRPNTTICPVVTSRLAKRRLMSLMTPEVRRHALLENLQAHHAMARVDRLALVAVCMAATVVMMMVVLLGLACLLLPPGAPQHPQRHADDQHGGGELKVRLGRL